MTDDTTKPPLFAAYAGTVLGRAHAHVQKNNQDAAAIYHQRDRVAVAVTDGCSSGSASEVGARLAAVWLARAACESAEGDPAGWVPRVGAGLLAALDTIASALSPPAARAAFVREHLLFSYLVAFVGGGRAVVFGAGDGVFSLDGAVVVKDPGPANAPAYAAYALLPGSVSSDPTVHVDAPAEGLRTLLVATDGAIPLVPGELDALARAPRYAENPSLLQKRLTVLARTPGLLADDTTVAVIRAAGVPS